MVESDQDQKTEAATEKRVREAREEGQLAVSREMSTLFLFIAIFSVISWFGPGFGHGLVLGLRVFLEKPEQISLIDGGLQNALTGLFMTVGLSATLVFGTLLVMSVLGTMLQTAFYINPSRIKLEPEKVFSLQALKRLFSTDSLVELAKSFAKLVVLGYIAYRLLRPVYEKSFTLIDMSFRDVLVYLDDRAFHMLLVFLAFVALIAVVDFLYVRHKYFKGLRMTKQEIKDEYKQTEGDPFIKGRLRRIRMEKARKRMMANVPKASVVITNPTHYAVALEYDASRMAAPVLVAKGPDLVALRIRKVAEEHDIPLVSNPPLARALYDTVELDQPIAPEHYRAVAEVISYVYKIKGKKK